MPVVSGLDSSIKSCVPRRGEIADITSSMAAGDLEVALLPAVEAMKSGNYQVIPCSCAAVLGPSRLFMFFSNRLPTEIQRVLVDKEDYGIIPAAKLLLHRKLMINPEFFSSPVPMAPGAFNFGEEHGADAYLVTGKHNLFIRQDAFSFSLDLTLAWYEYSRLPFVIHCWAVRKGVKLLDTERELADIAKRNEGSREVAERSAERWGVSQSGVSAVYSRAFTTGFDPQIVQSLRKLGQDLNQARIMPIRPISVYTNVSRKISGA
ncbi:MAG: hypothetical protein JJU11_10835 [Candidatus Sumerlaeia bacterium]|nr:hypothetical protein [Candidatus Sumerlaeia bacterium]